MSQRRTNLTALGIEAKTLLGKTKTAIPVAGHLHLDYSKIHYLTPKEQLLLQEGAKWVTAAIPIEEEITILLEKLEFNYCDYQAEGLFFAMANWMARTYNFELPAYEYSYNREKWRYEFPLLEGGFYRL